MSRTYAMMALCLIAFISCAFLLPPLIMAQTSETQPTELRYRGPVRNTTHRVNSGFQMDLVIDATSNISGTATFIRMPQTLRLCGAGPVTGRQVDRDLQFQFVSDDTRAGCTFTQGITFTFTGTLSADWSTFQGEYSTDSVPVQQGVFTTTLTFDRYLPRVHR